MTAEELGVAASYPVRMLVAYPVLGGLGAWMTIGLRQHAPGETLALVLAVLVLLGVGAGAGVSAGLRRYDGSERAPIGAAASGALLTIPLWYVVDNAVGPDLMLWACGVFFLGMFVGFALSAIWRRFAAAAS